MSSFNIMPGYSGIQWDQTNRVNPSTDINTNNHAWDTAGWHLQMFRTVLAQEYESISQALCTVTILCTVLSINVLYVSLCRVITHHIKRFLTSREMFPFIPTTVLFCYFSCIKYNILHVSNSLAVVGLVDNILMCSLWNLYFNVLPFLISSFADTLHSLFFMYNAKL